MGKFLLSAVLLVLYLARGTNAARPYHPTGQELKNQTSQSIRRLFDLVLPLDGTPGNTRNYFAGHATASGISDSYYGVMATMDVYGFSLNRDQITASSIWIINDGESASLTSINAIQIGWEVKPSFYGDSHTHLAGIWTTDGFQKTGCPNMNCPGYQRENGTSIALGDIIEHVSQPNGAKQFVTIKVLKDKVSGDWLVYYGLNKDPELIGRFPKSLFTGGLADRGTTIKVGGFIQAPATDLAPMGNGYLPTKPTGAAAASLSEINFFDKDGHATRVTEDLHVYVSDPATYSLTNMADSRFFYGGPSQPSA